MQQDNDCFYNSKVTGFFQNMPPVSDEAGVSSILKGAHFKLARITEGGGALGGGWSETET